MKDFISETKKYIQSFSRNEEFSLIAARLKINLCQPFSYVTAITFA